MLVPLKFFSPASLPFGLIIGVSLSFILACVYLARRNIIIAATAVSLAIILLLPVSARIVDPRFPDAARQILAATDRPVFVARLQTGRLSQQHAVFSYHLNRQIAQAHSVKPILERLQQGEQLIISDTDWLQLKKDAGAALPADAHIHYSWNQWREALPLGTIQQAWTEGELMLLQESYHIVSRP